MAAPRRNTCHFSPIVDAQKTPAAYTEHSTPAPDQTPLTDAQTPLAKGTDSADEPADSADDRGSCDIFVGRVAKIPQLEIFHSREVCFIPITAQLPV